MTRRHGEAVQVALLFLMLLVVFFWRAIFLGQKLVPGDIIYEDPIYASHVPPGLTSPHNTLLYDQAYQFYPWRVYTVRVLRQGLLPWWNPYIYCGSPFLAADQPAVFYPINVLAYPFSAADAALVTALVRLLVAGLTTYWFLRAIGAGRFGALLGGVSYAFGGFMIVFLGHPHTNVATWLPALFLTLEWLYRKSTAQHVAWVALVTAAQLTGGHAELCLYTLTAGGLYYLFRVVSARWGQRHREAPGTARPFLTRGYGGGAPAKSLLLPVLSFSAAMILGFALAAIHVLPFLEWLRQNAELELRLATKGAHAAHVGLRYWVAGLPLLVLPNLFGNPTWPSGYQSVLPFWNFVEQTVYIGIIGLALAIGGAVASWTARRGGTCISTRGGRRPAPDRGRDIVAAEEGTEYPGWRRATPAWFMSVLALAALGAALRWPVFDWINHLPLFSIDTPGRLRLIYVFAASVLAGLGAGQLSASVGPCPTPKVGNGQVPQEASLRSGETRFAASLGSGETRFAASLRSGETRFAASLGSGEPHLAKGTDAEHLAPMTGRIRRLLLSLAALAICTLVLMRWIMERASTASVQGGGTAGAPELGAVRWAFGLANPGMYWPVPIALAAFVVLTLYQRRILRRTTMQLLLLLLVVVDLFAFGMNFHTTVRQEVIFPQTPVLELLQSDKDLFRVVGTNIDLMPNSSMVYGLQDARGLDFPDQRYLELCEAIGGQDRLGYGIVFTEQLQPRLLGLMNVKYVLSSSDLDDQVLSHLSLLAVDGDIRLYRNQSFLPRSFIVHRARVVGNAQEALAALQAPDLDLKGEIVLEEPLPDAFPREAVVPSPGAVDETCEITRYDPNHVTVMASASANGFLFLSDRYDPGWKAYVDGVEAELYRADYVFRAVYLMAGQHKVDFVYAPRSFALALPVTVLALVILVLLLGSSWLQASKRGAAVERPEAVESNAP